MRTFALSALGGLLIAILVMGVFIFGYGPFRLVPTELPADVLNAMPAEKRAEWIGGQERRIRGMEAIRMIAEDRPVLLAFLGAGFATWLAGTVIVLGAITWRRQRVAPDNSSRPAPLRGTA